MDLGASIIGCGKIHGVHAEAVTSCPDAHLVGVVDPVSVRAEKTAEEYGAEVYADYQEVLADDRVDVVHLCTPHHLHARMAVRALRAGKHVLTEKPMAIKVHRAQEMIACAEEHGRYLGVVFQNRYNEDSRIAKEIIDSGRLGAVLGARSFVTWDRDASYYESDAWRGRWDTEGGGVLINQAIHTLDLMLWLVDDDVARVEGHVSTRCLKDVIEVEDTGEATIFFDGGAIGLFYATNCFCTNSPIGIEIVCEKGRLQIGSSGRLVVEREGREEKITDQSGGAAEKGKTYWGRGHESLVHDFYHSIQEGKDFFVPGEEGIRSLEIVCGIYEATGDDGNGSLTG